MSNERKLRLQLKLNGQAFIVAPANSLPLQQLEIEIETLGPDGNREQVTKVNIDLRQGQSAEPQVQNPD